MGFIEAMNLIHKEDRFLAGMGASRIRGSHDAADIGHVAFDSAEAFEAGLGRAGDHLSQRGFSRSGWAVEKKGRNAVCLDRAAEHLPRAKNVILPTILLEGARTHSRGKGGIAVGDRIFRKKFVHSVGWIIAYRASQLN